MYRPIKFVLILMIICLGLEIGLVSLAQENATTGTNEEGIIEEVVIDQEVSAENLSVKEPRLLPDSPFYFLKEWNRKIRSVFTFNSVKKIELENKFANERLIELKKLVEKKKDPEILKKTAEKYKNAVEKIKSQAEKIKEKTQENPKVKEFMEKYTSQQILHQKLLEKLEEQVPLEVFEKIKEVRESHLERFKDVMLKLEEKDRIAQQLKDAVETQTGSKFKEFKDLEILKRVRNKMPEDMKEKLIEKEGEILETLKGKLEKLSEEEQERFKKYIEQIPGEKESQLEILENIKSEIKEKEQACIDSGGKVSTSICCKSANDFPNLCLIGPCGCAPEYSYEVKICDCGPGKCFNGNKCILSSSLQPRQEIKSQIAD